MKKILLKNYFNLILLGDNSLSITERFYYLWRSTITFAPIAYLLDAINLWFKNNKLFFGAVILFIFINMLFGMYVHKKNKTFEWFEVIKKTITMVVACLISYFVLEVVLRTAGSNVVTEAFRATLQVATLLYPGSKVLKNIFIFSNGEHPPKWIMKKIYNFQKNGDLQKLLDQKKDTDCS